MTSHGICGAAAWIDDEQARVEECARAEVAGHLAHRYLTSDHCVPGSEAWVSACMAVDEAEEMAA